MEQVELAGQSPWTYHSLISFCSCAASMQVDSGSVLSGVRDGSTDRCYQDKHDLHTETCLQKGVCLTH